MRLRHDKQISEIEGNELIYQTIKSSMTEKEVLGLEFLTLRRRYNITDILIFNT